MISSFLRELNEEAVEGGEGNGYRDGYRGPCGKNLVDRVVVTIAPAFLQGFNVLTKPRSEADDASSDVSTGNVVYCDKIM